MTALGNLRKEFESFKKEVYERLSVLEGNKTETKVETPKEDPISKEIEEEIKKLPKKLSSKKKKYDTVILETNDDDIIGTEA